MIFIPYSFTSAVPETPSRFHHSLNIYPGLLMIRNSYHSFTSITGIHVPKPSCVPIKRISHERWLSFLQFVLFFLFLLIIIVVLCDNGAQPPTTTNSSRSRPSTLTHSLNYLFQWRLVLEKNSYSGGHSRRTLLASYDLAAAGLLLFIGKPF